MWVKLKLLETPQIQVCVAVLLYTRELVRGRAAATCSEAESYPAGPQRTGSAASALINVNKTGFAAGSET